MKRNIPGNANLPIGGSPDANREIGVPGFGAFTIANEWCSVYARRSNAARAGLAVMAVTARLGPTRTQT